MKNELFHSISSIKPVLINRLSTNIPDFDSVLGTSIDGTSGFPEGKISMWSGNRGTGKTRIAIYISKLISKQGKSVLYFQSETTKEDFATWVNDTQNYPNFFVSEVNSLNQQIQAIKELNPYLVFIDSVNQMEEFKTGQTKAIKKIIEGNNVSPGLKSVIQNTHTHIVLLCQINKDGKTSKGSSTLNHLVDAEFFIEKISETKVIFKATNKNRYGKTGDNIFSSWIHQPTQIIPLSDNDNISQTNNCFVINNNNTNLTQSKRQREEYFRSLGIIEIQ